MQPTDVARTRRVLVVDDEPALRTLCQRLVWSLGHECEVADSSVEVAKLVADSPFDLILCDYRLRGETAEAVVDAIAAVAPSLVSRVVLTSGAMGDPEVSALAEEHGLGVISKPYGMSELVQAIERAAAGDPRS